MQEGTPSGKSICYIHQNRQSIWKPTFWVRQFQYVPITFGWLWQKTFHPLLQSTGPTPLIFAGNGIPSQTVQKWATPFTHQLVYNPKETIGTSSV